MNYHIFIDESGEFDEAILSPEGKKQSRASIVGGVCSTLSAEDWETGFILETENQRKQTKFPFLYPTHFHCSELFAGKYLTAKTTSNNHFVSFGNHIHRFVSDNALFLFASKNPSGSFEYSPQATYVLNLITAIKGAMETLAAKAESIDACTITIAQRTIYETTQSRYDDYMGALIKHVRSQLFTGDTAGVNLVRKLDQSGGLIIQSAVAMSFDGKKANGGLTAADFACGAIRYGSKASIEPIVFTPSSNIGGDISTFYEQQTKHLIEAKQYAAAIDFLRLYFPRKNGAPELKPALKALRNETDHNILHRELNALLTEADYLIEKRTVMTGALNDATLILEALNDISTAHLESNSSPELVRQWSDLQAHALPLLSSCYNHTGAVGPQAIIEDKLTTLLKTYKPKMSLSYHQRAELLLEVKTRNLNLLFNDYRFAEVLEAIEEDVNERENVVPADETDELLGKMQGSIGQACAFQARHDDSWSEMARDYFTRSLKHFQPGTLFHSMSVNYLATLAWQEGDIDKSLTAMNLHPAYPDLPSTKALMSALPNLLSMERMSAFDAVNYLRISASAAENGQIPSVESLQKIKAFWLQRMTPEHPHEQLAKWLGYLYYLQGSYTEASELYKRGVAICESQGFTLQTIALSIIALNIISNKTSSNANAYAEGLTKLQELASQLENQSAAFATYLSHYGGADAIISICKSPDHNSAKELARLLPFNYA